MRQAEIDGKPLCLLDKMAVEKYQVLHRRYESKKALSLILRLEELDWVGSDIKKHHNEILSEKIIYLIELKSEFYRIHCQIMFAKL